MNQHPFAAFINLISLDQEIRKTYDAISALKGETETLLGQKQELIDRLDQFKRHVHDLKKMVHEQELHIQELDAKEKQKKEAFENLQNPKGYQSLKKEIDGLKQAQHEAETELLTVWNKAEVAQKELADQQTSYNSKIEDLHTTIEKKQEEVTVLQQTLEEKRKERPAKEAGIPNEWLEKYTHMRMRVEDPVVSVMQGSCGACFYTITDQEMIRLKRKALVQCKGCFRLLYLQDAMDESTSTEPTEETK